MKTTASLACAMTAALVLAAGAFAQPSTPPAHPGTPAPATNPATTPKPGEPSQPAPTAGTPTTPATAAPDAPKKDEKPATPPSPYVLNHTEKTIDGQEKSLADYKGKVILIVNVASKCGYTPQYEGLEKLYTAKQDKGLVILGFPANDFGKQEPGTNEEIKAFCTSKYSVTFPMFSKIVVTGPKKDPLYIQLAAQPAPVGGEPKWNFTKWLVDREGNVVARYDSRTTPDDDVLVKKIDELLIAK